MNRTLQGIGVLTILCALVVGFTPLATVIAGTLAVAEDLTPADAIVVLGSGVEDEGQLDSASLARAVRGIEAFHIGLAPLLVMLGTTSNIEGHASEAAVRAQLAERLGVDPDAILTEDRGLNTRLEAELARERLEPLGVRSVLLVTGSQHLIRAGILFENAGFEVHPVVANDFTVQPNSFSERFELAGRVLAEQLARIYYRAAGYL